MLKLNQQVPAVRDNDISARVDLERTLPMSYVFLENRKSLKKGFEVVTMAVETGEKTENFIFFLFCGIYKATKMFPSLYTYASQGF